jgi:hypothetical protein
VAIAACTIAPERRTSERLHARGDVGERVAGVEAQELECTGIGCNLLRPGSGGVSGQDSEDGQRRGNGELGEQATWVHLGIQAKVGR